MKKALFLMALGMGLFTTMTMGGMMTSQSSQPMFLNHPSYLSITIKDNHESLIDIRDLHEIAYGPSPEIPNNQDYTKMRKTVYEKLKQAQNLLPKGYHFCLYEAYRSLSTQKLIFETFFEKVKHANPNWSHEKIFTEATRLVSPVMNLDGSKNIPPHSTGGAIDVYLVNDAGQVVDMGIHPKDWMQDLDGSLSLPLSNKISTAARKNRKIMYDALAAVGFINYQNEYWHWSYGDRYWAYHTKHAHAIYDTVQ